MSQTLHDDLPPFSLENALIAVALFTVMWGVFYSIEYFVIDTFMNVTKNSTYGALDLKDKKFYVSYYHSILHALLSGLLAAYCFVYADGKANTTWFHD